MLGDVHALIQFIVGGISCLDFLDDSGLFEGLNYTGGVEIVYQLAWRWRANVHAT